MQHLAALIALTLSVAHAHLLLRDDTSVTFVLDPTPTLTDNSVASAYTVYVDKCGRAKDSVAYSFLPTYTSFLGIPAQITDAQFLSSLDALEPSQFPFWSQAKSQCSDAEFNYRTVVHAADPFSTATLGDNTLPVPPAGCLATGIPSGISLPGGLPAGLRRDNQPASCQPQVTGSGNPSATGGSAAPTTNKNAASVIRPGVALLLVALGMICAVA
ncbi:hypothetical protein DFH06DRAFT_1150034 [Mycena polygramma]|nr:hypothetical protein DFH06DRAFT_1150034 [Mycena polygramma]